MLPGSSGFRPMPRKMAGIAMITMEASIVAIVMLSVVLDRAIHLYRSGRPPLAVAEPFTCPESTLCRTLTQSTANHLLDGNYLLRAAASGHELPAVGRVVRSGGRWRPLEDVVHRDGSDEHEGGDVV